MLEGFLRKAVEIRADRIEIEYKDGAELVTAFRGTVGIGLSSVDSSHRDVLFREMEDLKKRRKAILGCNMYRLTFSNYESFGEWVYVIEIHGDTKVKQRLQRTSQTQPPSHNVIPDDRKERRHFDC